MHLPSLPTTLLTLSLSVNLNLDTTLASALPQPCSTISSVSFLTPRTMSVLGIRRECIEMRKRQLHSQKSMIRRALEYIVPSPDEGELYGREWQNEPRALEGVPHNPLIVGSDNEGMQEPFELFESLASMLEDVPTADIEREDEHDEVIAAGLSIAQPYTRPRRPCHRHRHHGPRHALKHACHSLMRETRRCMHGVFTAFTSIDDNLFAAALVALGIVILVLLAVETTIGHRRSPRHKRMVEAEAAAAKCSKGRACHSRNGSRRHFDFLNTIEENEDKGTVVEFVAHEVRYDEKDALVMSFSQ